MTGPAAQAKPDSSAPHGFEWIRWVLFGLASVSLVVGLLYLVWPDWHRVHAEGGPLEVTQLVCAIGSLLTAILIVLTRRGRDRLDGAGLTTLFLLLAARELDLQERLNKEYLGEWAVSYRLRWWTSWDVPLEPKLLWGGVAALIGAALFIPPVIIRAPVLRLLRAGDAGTWLFVAGFLFYGAGYVLDDVLGRGVLVDGDQGQIIEEFCELLGAVSLFTSVILAWRRPLSSRVGELSPGGREE